MLKFKNKLTELLAHFISTIKNGLEVKHKLNDCVNSLVSRDLTIANLELDVTRLEEDLVKIKKLWQDLDEVKS